jgi:hypothetical protein
MVRYGYPLGTATHSAALQAITPKLTCIAINIMSHGTAQHTTTLAMFARQVSLP